MFIKLIKWMFLWLLCDVCSAAGSLFHVTNTNNILYVSTTANHYYPVAGIKLNTAGYHFENPGDDCSVASNGFCLFPTNSTMSREIVLSGPAGKVNFTLCLNGVGPVSCQNYQATITLPSPPQANNFAYVTNGDNIISACAVKDDGQFGLCSDAATDGSIFITPRGIALSDSNLGAFIVTNGDDSVHFCPINPDTHLFGTCHLSATGITSADGLAINHANTYGYVTTAGELGQTVTKCTINLDHSWSDCEVKGPLQEYNFAEPRGIVINNTDQIAYIVNNGTDDTPSSVTRCQLNESGSLTTCLDSGNSGIPFRGAFGIALNRTGTFAYVTNAGNDTVSVCPVQEGGAFGTCVDSRNSGVPFNGLNGIMLNSAGTLAYIANGGTNAILICPIDPVTGLFGACVNSGSSGLDFVTPIFLALTASIL